jgi:hypothetical protein
MKNELEQLQELKSLKAGLALQMDMDMSAIQE